MGNKLNTRRRSSVDATDGVTRRRRRKPARSQSASQVDGRANRASMPELGGAVPYRAQDEPDVDIKVYRSYGDLARPKASTLDRPDYKVYRKSTEGLQKYASLPRHFGRSKSAVDVPNGTLRDDGRRARRDQAYTPDYPEIMPRRRSPQLPDNASSHGSVRTSKRVSASSSLSSLAKAPVTSDDFPSTSQVRGKLICFEEQFCRSLADKYAGLADTLQLSALPIALTRGPDGHYSRVKLLDYLEGDTVPLNPALDAPDRYVMLVPESLFSGLMHVRRDKISDLELWTSLARDLVTCVAVEAANELSRMFEYQIALLAGDAAVRVLADHAAACVIEYVKRQSAYLDRNSAVVGVIRGEPDYVSAGGSPKYLSVIVGNRELKWEVHEVFKRPALRKDTLLFGLRNASIGDGSAFQELDPEVDGLSGPPWRYYTNKDCNPQLFGYRGLLLEWDWIQKAYRLDDSDLSSFGEDITDPISYPDDFHRLYSPYRLLIGHEVLLSYSQLKKTEADRSLADYVKELAGSERDEIQPVYRPLVALSSDQLEWGALNLDNVDLTRAQLNGVDLSRANLRRSKLLMAELSGTKFSTTDEQSQLHRLRGTDISYTNLVHSTLDQASLHGMTARHVMVAQPEVRNRPETGIVAEEQLSDNTKRRNIPTTLPLTNGHQQVTAPGVDGRQQDRVDGIPDNLDGCCVSDSRGNLMTIEQANKEQRKNKKVEKNRKTINDTGLDVDTVEGQSEAVEHLIEEKQKKIRERKKKIKKRPVSPLQSTPTEPIPEKAVFIQAPQASPTNPESMKPRHAPDERWRGSPQRPSAEQTEEFFRESQPQYEMHAYQNSSVTHGERKEKQQPQLAGAENAAGDHVDGSKGASNKQPSDSSGQNAVTQASPSKEGEKSTKTKKGKKAEKAKASKKSGEKKSKKKSRSKTPEREESPSATANKIDQQQRVNGTTPERPSSASPSNFHAVDAAPLGQKSPGKALSATDIHEHSVGTLPDRSSSAQGNREGELLRPRMTKSLSHHGNLTTDGATKLHNLSLDSYALGLRTARQIYGLSKEEIEYITRSQIFDMIKGLQVENIQTNLPNIDKNFVGREGERDDVTDLVSSPGRIVTVTGCYGNGKSALATAVGWEAAKKFVVPIVVDVRGCLTVESIARRLTSTFELQFGLKDMALFYNWLNCHEQRLLFIIDNIDIGHDEDSKLSDMLDGLVSCVRDARVLCLCRRNFFKGTSTHEVYRLGDARGFGSELLARLLPDLHDEGIDGLLDVCAHNPFVIGLVSNAFFVDDVDSGRLFEQLVEQQNHALLDRVEASLGNLAYDDGERETLCQLARCVLIVLDNIPLDYAELLQKASHSPASFDAETVAELAERSDVSAVKESLEELRKIGFIIGAAEDRFYLPSLIRLVNQCKISDNGAETMKYCKHTLEKIKTLCAKYHSKHCERAVADFREDFDRYVDVFCKVIQREDTYELCPDFASLPYALFLGEMLPEEVYLNLYESFAQEAANRDDVASECRALCCLSHRLAAEESVSAAKHAVDRAYELVHASPDSASERAFCLRCMGQIVWQEADDRNRALMLIKKSLDLYKEAHGSRDLQTMYTNELYARMLTRQERYQTARHFYNISDLFVGESLDSHPLLIEGYDCRRIIWDGLCLFQRATDMAKKALEVSRIFLGEHPTTARMAANLCEAIIKRGSLNDAIRAGIDALSIRSKVLGDHQETGDSYKKLAYLMLRSGQYDEAVRFGQSALEVYDKVQVPERAKAEVKNLMAQARLRLDYKSHVFVELHGRDASRKNLSDECDDLGARKTLAALSTEV